MANEKRLIRVCDATKVYNGIALYMAENAYLNDTALDVLKMVANWVDEAPTVDAVEVVHASWIEDGYYGNPFVCSHCGSEGCYSGDFMNKQYYPTNYCPNCGAKMDGGNEDG